MFKAGVYKSCSLMSSVYSKTRRELVLSFLQVQ